MKKNKIKTFARKVLTPILIGLLTSVSVSFAALTLSGTSVSSDGALTLTGAASSVLDLGASNTLSLQTTNNGPVTAGTGLFSIQGKLAVGTTTAVSAAFLTVASIDSSSTITIGNASGTTITIGRSGQIVAFPGTVTMGTSTAAGSAALTVSSIDASSTIFIGNGIATAMTIGSSSRVITFPGTLNITGTTVTIGTSTAATGAALTVSSIDASSTIFIGNGIATAMTIGSSSRTVTFPGIISLTGTLTAGSSTVNGSLTINSGVTLTKVLNATSSIGFGTIAAAACAQNTITVTGAGVATSTTRDTVAFGPGSTIETGLALSAFVSSANTVTIRACNVATSTTVATASSTWSVDVWQH